MCKVVFSMSEGQASRFPDWEDRELTVQAVGGVYLMFEFLQDADATVLAHFDGTFWIAAADGREYSDVGIVLDDPAVTAADA